MKIVQIRTGNRLPAAAAKVGTVIARRVAVFTLAEIKIIGIFTIRISQSLLEPLMLVGAVVDDQIHDNVHITFFSLG